MKRNILKSLIIITVILSGLIGLSAMDYLNDIEEGEISGFPTIKGVTDSGIEITIIQVAPADDPELEIRVVELISSMKIIPVKTIRITVKPGKFVELFITNDPFMWDGYDMDEYLPSGFTLKLDGAVDYDADLFVDRMHIRLEGFYRSEEEFLNKMTGVIDDPGTFLMSRDPEYILSTFMSMMSADEEIRNEIETQKVESGESRTELQTEFQNELQEAVTSLKTENQELKDELADLKYNNFIMEYRSFFGGIRMVERAAVDWIVAEKTVNPGMTPEELAAGLTAAKGIEVKTKAISLILALYFGEYPE